jgi:hypothetical protein
VRASRGDALQSMPPGAEASAVDTQTDLTADRHPWRAALVIGLSTIALGMAYTMLVMPAITHIGRWWVTADVWPPVLAARFVANGALGYMYEATPFFTAGPVFPLLLAPVAALGDALQLTDSYRYLVPRPSLWLVYGPYALAFGIVLLYAARALGQRLWLEEGLAGGPEPPRHLWWTQVSMFGLVLMPVAIVYGHFEDVLALALFFLGIRSTISGRFAHAALWFGLAIATNQWALLGVPILLAAAPMRSRARTLMRTLLVPGILFGYILITDWASAAPALLRPRAFPQVGHAALWVSRSTQVIVASPFRLSALVVAVALGWWLRGRGRPRLLLAGFALAVLARPLFEPVIFAYDVAPALALLFLHERVAGGTGLRTAVGGGALLLFFLVHPHPWLWWSVTAAVLLWLTAPAIRDVLRREELAGDPGKEETLPISSLADLNHVAT